ncbi:hypothetical protein HYW44_03540 [Candidatus Daviesbacteria bacterium]|nr:hypothetical protein [Candidatus Daviesbacteria bacterium]
MTLTEASALTKKGLIVTAITIFIALATWGIWHYYYNYIYLPGLPPVVEKPTLAFGPLPKLKFPDPTVASSNFSYSLDTETGALPEKLPELFKVYSIAQLATDLLALDRAKNLAGALEFNKNPEAISPTQYKFLDDISGGELIVDLDTGNFKFRKNYATSSGDNFERIEDFINEDKQSQSFKNFLSSRELLKDQLKNGRTRVTYNNPVKKDSTQATINLWQENVEDIPIVTPKFNEGLIKTISINNQNLNKKYISMDYIFWPIDLNNFGTYPIKKVDEAFEELKNGEGFIAIEPLRGNVSISKIYLAYYLSEEYTNYLQPVYVFEGSGFASIVQAVKNEFVEKSD